MTKIPIEDPTLIENCKAGIKTHSEQFLAAGQSYNKAILSLSTATLGYTFVFVKVILNSAVHHDCLLAFTWVCFIVSILFLLISFIVEQFHSEHRIKYYYWCLTGKSDSSADREKKHWADDKNMFLPILSGGFFLLGVILFSIFVNNYL